jgi:hypothetical protein
VCVDPERDGRVSVPEPRGHHVDGDTRQEERRRVNVAQVVKARVRERFGR